MSLVADKIQQACDLLKELQIDAWIVFVRETRLLADPVLPLVVGGEATWSSYFIYTATGDAFAIVGRFDKQIFESDGRFTDVRTYDEDVRDSVRALLDSIAPKSVVVNYSAGDPAADGLTHGMYQLMREHLEGTPYLDRMQSAEELITKLRSRKLPEEVSRLKSAALMANEVWNEAAGQISTGQSEKEIAALIDGLIKARGAANSFTTAVNAGDKSSAGHGPPTDAVLSEGDLLHVDFGIELDEYCSDLQRLIYFRKPAESIAPPELIEAFNLVKDIIPEAGKLCVPGAKGFEVDRYARETLRDHGYPEYQHALGHQLGRSVHDGGAIIGPQWARYRHTPLLPLERDNVFTLELEIMLPGIGCVGLEEDMHITDNGAEFLCPRQMELTIK
jgi:Xaa-Pro aminopeptidase